MGEKPFFRGHVISARGKLVHDLELLVRVRICEWVRVIFEFGTSLAFCFQVDGRCASRISSKFRRRLKMRERIERAG